MDQKAIMRGKIQHALDMFAIEVEEARRRLVRAINESKLDTASDGYDHKVGGVGYKVGTVVEVKNHGRAVITDVLTGLLEGRLYICDFVNGQGGKKSCTADELIMVKVAL